MRARWPPARPMGPPGARLPDRPRLLIDSMPRRCLPGPLAPTRPPCTRELWIYDLRSNRDFTLKTNPLQRADLDDFVACYHPENRQERAASWSLDNPDGRWRRFPHEELLQRDRVSLDLFWVRDRSL